MAKIIAAEKQVESVFEAVEVARMSRRASRGSSDWPRSSRRPSRPCCCYARRAAMTENELRLEFLFNQAMKLRDAEDLVAARVMLEQLLHQLEAPDQLLRGHAHRRRRRPLIAAALRRGHASRAAEASSRRSLRVDTLDIAVVPFA